MKTCDSNHVIWINSLTSACTPGFWYLAIMRIMQFHRHHGSAITLSENNMVATRAGDFCNGIVFSSLPLSVHQKLCLELVAATDWSGAVRLGVTTQDPASWSPEDLPRYVCPDLTNKEGYWARALKENYAASGNRVTFYITSQRQLHYFINNEHKGVLLHHLPVGLPLWAMLDIYGNTVAAKFVPAGKTLSIIPVLCMIYSTGHA